MAYIHISPRVSSLLQKCTHPSLDPIHTSYHIIPSLTAAFRSYHILLPLHRRQIDRYLSIPFHLMHLQKSLHLPFRFHITERIIYGKYIHPPGITIMSQDFT